MADGKVIYEVRADDSKVGSDLDQANAKVKSGADKLASTIKTAAISAGVATIGKEIISLGAGFETSMAKASTLFGDVGVDTDGLNDKILSLSTSTGFAADSLGESLYNALSAGVPVTEDMGDALSFLERSTKLAKAGFTDVDTAMSATIKTLNAYGLSTDEADRIQKILMQTQNKGITTVGELGGVLAQVTPTAAAMNVEFEQVGAALATMTAKGYPAAQATTGLNSLLAELGKNGTTAAGNLEKAAAGTKYAGKSFSELMAEGVPLNEVLDLMGNYAAENNLSMIDMFSSIESGKAALSIAGQNSQTFADNLTAMSTEADVVDEAFQLVSDTVQEKFTKAITGLKNAGIELYQNALGPLIGVLLDLVLFFQEHETALKLLGIAIGTVTALVIAYNIQQALATSGLTLWQAVSLIAATATKALGTAFAFATGPIGSIILAIAAVIAIVILLADNWEEISKWLKDTWLDLKDAAVSTWGYIANFFTRLWEKIKDTFKKAVQFIKDIFNTIPEAIESVINAGIKLLNSMISGVNKVVGKIGLEAIPTIKTVTLPRLRTGLDFVPSDDFPALLHRGEMVLTAEEAALYRSGEDLVNQNITTVGGNSYYYITIDSKNVSEFNRIVKLAQSARQDGRSD